MKLKTNSLLLVAVLLFSSSCEWFKFKEEPSLEQGLEKPVARVNDKYLYPSDLERIISYDLSRQDSAKRAATYIKNWCKKQLIIAKSEQELAIDQTEIERKLLDYKYALLAHEYEKNYVNEQLDTVITENEIATYYEGKQDNFILKQNIFKGRYVKLPRNAPKRGTFRSLFRSNDPEDMEELRTYCVQFALNYSLDEDVWFNFDEVLVNSPLITIPNKAQFLRNNKNYESNDEGGIYFLRINDYRITDQTAPVDFVKDQIRNILLHRRKVELINNLEEDIYKKANENNEIEIYN